MLIVDKRVVGAEYKHDLVLSVRFLSAGFASERRHLLQLAEAERNQCVINSSEIVIYTLPFLVRSK
jgi:hypothetical protein